MDYLEDGRMYSIDLDDDVVDKPEKRRKKILKPFRKVCDNFWFYLCHICSLCCVQCICLSKEKK